jgi:hypothetical protein
MLYYELMLQFSRLLTACCIHVDPLCKPSPGRHTTTHAFSSHCLTWQSQTRSLLLIHHFTPKTPHSVRLKVIILPRVYNIPRLMICITSGPLEKTANCAVIGTHRLGSVPRKIAGPHGRNPATVALVMGTRADVRAAGASAFVERVVRREGEIPGDRGACGGGGVFEGASGDGSARHFTTKAPHISPQPVPVPRV